MGECHKMGLPGSSNIVFGSVETPSDVAEHLTANGWTAQPLVLVQAAPLPTLSEPVRVPEAVRVDLADAPSAQFLARLAHWKSALPEAAGPVLAGVGPVAFVEARSDDELLATARGAVVEDWLHIGLVEVDPAARRQGLARVVTAAAGQWAARHGASRALLQVEEENGPAVALYQSLGFTTHHRYVTYHRSAVATSTC